MRALVLLMTVLLLTGCGTGEDGAEPAGNTPVGKGVLTVAQAIHAGDQPVKVRGFVLVGTDGVTRICEALAESHPPQCGRPSLKVEGANVDSLKGVQTAQGVTWTDQVTLRGTLANGVLTVA